MLAAAEISVGLPFSLADDRLKGLLSGDGLGRASDKAYQAGLVEFSILVGPVGAISALSKRVRVSILPPRVIPEGTRVPLRWVATGVTAHFFPVLDADLDLCSDGDEASLLLIKARYEPPLGAVGAQVDRVLLRRVADLTINELLRRLAAMLLQPDRNEEEGAPATLSPGGAGKELT